MRRIDDIDMRILTELAKDAGLSVPRISKKIEVNPSVVYSRIKRLVKRGLIKRFTIEVDEESFGYVVTAIVGLNIDSKFREKIVEEILSFNQIREISEVTGRFDMLVLVKSKSLSELHEVVSSQIGKINGVLHTETFVEMKKRHRNHVYALP